MLESRLILLFQVSGLSGIQKLVLLEGLNVSHTPIVTDSLLCLQNHPTLSALNVSNTPNVIGDQALQYIAGNLLDFCSRKAYF